MKAEEIRKLRLINVDFNETQWGLNTFDEILEQFKGRCILNLDRCGNFIPHVVEVVERHGMREQILLKNAPDEKVLKIVEETAPEYMFMPIYMEEDTATEKIERMKINFVGAELVFQSENSPVIQEAYLDKMLKKGMTLWGNAVLYNYRIPLSAGHTDDCSLLEHPDQGWGWLAEKGFGIIQTDWTYQCCQYLKEKQYNK